MKRICKSMIGKSEPQNSRVITKPEKAARKRDPSVNDPAAAIEQAPSPENSTA
ncbi:MAG: hypothetical protein IKP38_10685 [Clostridia bacterium]|nr:hypothetical protein [Clostridia bacterium]